jgi:methionyl-tRNA formyltransferase
MEIAGKAERLKLLRSTLADGQGEPGEILDEQLTVGCGEGAVRLLELQRAGGKPVTAGQFLLGAKIKKGMKLA